MMFTITNEENVIYNISNPIYNFAVSWSYEKEVIAEKEVGMEKVKDNIEEDYEISDIALNSARTPDTWTETWILLLMTFILSNFIYFRKKIIRK
jgi:hypothetical protein